MGRQGIMSEDFGKNVRRFVSLYGRAVITSREFVNQLFDAYADFNPNAEEINAVFRDVPDELMDTLQSQLHELANVDFYCRTFPIGVPRTGDEIHRDALARQPELRRICEVLTPLVHIRVAR